MTTSYLGNDQFLSTTGLTGAPQWLNSPTGLFWALQQTDGNLVVYRGSPDDNEGALWASGRAGDGEAWFSVMQADGNFVVYRGNAPSPEGVLWATNTNSSPERNYFIIMQDDGNLVIYRGTGPDHNDGVVVWASDALDPVVAWDIRRIDFGIQSATVAPDGAVLLGTGNAVTNSNNQPQQVTVNGSGSFTSHRQWVTNRNGIPVGPSGRTDVPLPGLSDGTVTPAGPRATFFLDGSRDDSTPVTWSLPLTVPPKSTVVPLVLAKRAKATIRYAVNGFFTLRSGVRVNGQMIGSYTVTGIGDPFVVTTRPGAPAVADFAETVPQEAAASV